MKKINHQNHSKLDSPDRKNFLPADVILRETGLVAGNVVADIGAGTGYFSQPASAIVGGNGRVYALDSSPEMLSIIEKRYVKSAPNIVTVLTEEYDFKLPVQSVDYALLCLVLHEVEDKSLFIKKTNEILRPGGRCVIIEWNNRKTDKGPSLEERIDPYTLVALLNLSGFNEMDYHEYNRYFSFYTAVKNEA